LPVMAAVLVALLSGCGSAAQPGPSSTPTVGTPSPTPTPTSVPTATPVPTPKFIAVVAENYTLSAADVLTIVDPTGGHHGSVTFTPPTRAAPRALAAVQAPAVTAAGKAFYADSTGTVSSLAPDASPVQVASFPFRPGDELSFAVSPDGTQVMAIITMFGSVAATQYSIYLAASGGPARLLRGPVLSSSIARLFSWIAAGPVVVTDALYDFQGCESGECYPWGHAALVDPATGSFGAAVGGSDCQMWDVTGSAVLCSSGPVTFQGETPPNLSVRSVDGSSSRSVANTERCGGCPSDARLSPNGDVAGDNLTSGGQSVMTLGVVFDPRGTPRVVTAALGDFAPYLWFDAQTVIGVTNCPSTGCSGFGGPLATVGTSSPALQAVSLGLSGTPVGVLVG
jgi:hypothetical protein